MIIDVIVFAGAVAGIVAFYRSTSPQTKARIKAFKDIFSV